jgi:hypothetical protein
VEIFQARKNPSKYFQKKFRKISYAHGLNPKTFSKPPAAKNLRQNFFKKNPEKFPGRSQNMIPKLPFSRHRSHPKTQLKSRLPTTPNPAKQRPPFPNKARIGPQFGCSDPLFDRKLLEDSHKQGVRS